VTNRDLASLLRPVYCQDCGADISDYHKGESGRCHKCRQRWDRAGRPEPAPRIPLPAGSYGYSQAYGTARSAP
jgi:hypothetical protein